MGGPMRVSFLGTGGNFPIPTPTCTCEICAEAREEGVPYARQGNSIYLHDANALVDAPEFAYATLNRWGIDRVDYVFLTHWHPDHVNGLRVLQARDFAPVHADDDVGVLDAARSHTPTIVTTRTVYERTCEVLGALEHFVEEIRVADVRFLDDGPIEIGDIEASHVPYPLEGGGEEDATAFVFERDGRTLVIASDDARYLDESRLPDDIDVAVFECGLFHTAPDGTRILTETDRHWLRDELDHDEVLDRISRLAPDRTVLTEIEHLCARSFDDFQRREREYEHIRFAYDGLEIEV